MEDVFYLSDDKEKSISIDEINSFASFALTLDPLPEVTEAFGYAAALEDYYSKNEDQFSDDYKELISSFDGGTFLCTTIQLALIEKRFRSEGINESSMDTYQKYLEQYQKLLSFNHSKDKNSSKHML